MLLSSENIICVASIWLSQLQLFLSFIRVEEDFLIFKINAIYILFPVYIDSLPQQ